METKIQGIVESFTSTLKGVKLENNETIFNSQYNISTKCSILDEVEIIFRQSVGASVFVDSIRVTKKATNEVKKAHIEKKNKQLEELLFNNIKTVEDNLIKLDRDFSSSDVASLAMFLTSKELSYINI